MSRLLCAVTVLMFGTQALAAPATKPAPRYRYALDLDVDTRMALADHKRDEAIDQLQRLLPKFDDQNPDKPDLYFQLAEYYWEKYRYLYAQEETAFEAAYQKYQAAGGKGQSAVAEPVRDHRRAETFRTETLRIYERILSGFPKYGRTDEVLFALAYNLHERGKQAEAVARYHELIKRFPKSDFVPDAYVQLGDHGFDHNDLDAAESNFRKAFESQSPKIHSYALYKLAWCDYNRGKKEASLKKLHEVIAFAEQHGKEMVDLRNEALNDCVVLYTDLDRSEEGIAYFQEKADAARQSKLIAKLAYALADHGHHEHALKTFHYLIDREPLGAHAPEYQQAIVKDHEELRQRDKVKAEVKRLAEQYRPGSDWWRANEKDRGTIKDAFDVSEEAMRTVVTDYHREAQQTKQVETYRLARDIYKQYLDAFASSENPEFVSDFAFNLRFYYAEILWTLEEWEAAAEQYDRVVAMKIPDRDTAKEVSDEGYRKTAAYDAVLAYDKLLKIESGQLAQSTLKDGQKVDERKDKGGVERGGKIYKRDAKDLEEKPLSKFEEKLVGACDAYTRLFAGEKDEIDVRYQAAVILYDRNHFVDAAKRFGEIILRWPEEKRSQQAADLTMFILDAREEWFELARLSAEFLNNKKLARPGSEFASRVAGIVEGSRYKWIDEVVYKKDKDPGRAAQEFLRFVQEFPRAKTADRALAYAVLMYQELQQLDRGVEVAERTLREYPGTPLEPKVRYTLARMLERSADYLRAAQQYEAFIASYDRQAAALAEERKRLGGDARPKKAKAEKRKGAAAEADHASPSEARQERVEEVQILLDEAKPWLADAQFNAALWYEGLGQADHAVAAYRQYLNRFGDRKDAPEIAFNVGVLHERAGRHAEAVKAFQDFERAFGRDARATAAQHYLARSHQMQAQLGLKRSADAERLDQELVRGFGKLPPETKKDDAVLAAYAQARFLALEPAWRTYSDLKLKRVASLKQDLLAKRRKLVELEKAYTEVVSLGVGEWGIAALTRIGLAYADMAQAITDSPSPKGLDADQLDLYRGELQSLVMPLEDRAFQVLEQGLAKAYELNLYTSWTLLAQDRVNGFKPGAYPKVREVPLQGSEVFVTAPLQTGEPDKERAEAPSAPAPIAGGR